MKEKKSNAGRKKIFNDPVTTSFKVEREFFNKAREKHGNKLNQMINEFLKNL